MANALEPVIPKIIAQGLLALRSRVVLPQLVNRDYDTDARQKGDTIDVPIPSAVASNDVTPGAAPVQAQDSTPTKVPIQLNNWKEAPFYMTDKDIAEAMRGILPMQASEAISTLARDVNAQVFSNYVGVYSAAGVPGTTPFGSDVSEATAARKLLNLTEAPLDFRRMVIDPEAEAAALGLRAFQDASFGGGAGVILEGQIGHKLGFDWFMDQQVPTHTPGTLSDGTDMSALINDAAVAIGQKTVSMDSVSLTGTIVVGDIFTVAGDSQQYVVTAGATAAGNAISVAFEPGAKVAWADDAAVTFNINASSTPHVVNLGFHRDAFALAVRPLEAEGDGLGNLIMSQTDPVSGLALRLEVERQHRQTKWSFDILWGSALVRPELAVRMMG